MSFWQEIINGFECDSCGKHFPKSTMVYIDSMFKEVAGKYCVCCSHKIFDLMGYCDECENEYPKTHLYTNFSDETLCKDCIRRELE